MGRGLPRYAAYFIINGVLAWRRGLAMWMDGRIDGWPAGWADGAVRLDNLYHRACTVVSLMRWPGTQPSSGSETHTMLPRARSSAVLSSSGFSHAT